VKPPDQAPLSSLRLAELIGGLLPPGVFENQIVPRLTQIFPAQTFSLIEPPRTFRFTVSRTF